MDQITGAYVLLKDRRFTCGITSFAMCVGTTVYVKQVDKEYKKVLIDFGGRLMDWYPDSILNDFVKV